MEKIKLATVFSGIGAIEFAFRRLNIPIEVVFACDNGEREVKYDKEKEKKVVASLSSIQEKKKYVDYLYSSLTRKTNFVEKTYLTNYGNEMNNHLFFQDICLLDGRDFKDKIDLFVGGSPCQSFSIVGEQRGIEDTRGTLFYEYARLVKEIQPRVFIYENVRNMLTHNKGKTWEIIKSVFDELGYNIDFKVLNAMNFGIPQKRNRLFVVGIRKDLGIFPVIPLNKADSKQYTMQDFLLSHCDYGNFMFEKNSGELSLVPSKGAIEERYFLSNAVREYVLKSGTKNWCQKPEIDLTIARTLLKTMGNCHRSGVDNYITENGRIRMLTERECLRLMGFTDDFIMPVSVAQAYKQAGNSIVVDVLMEILKKLIEQNVFSEVK